MRTTAQRLADLTLGIPVEEWIARSRAAGITWERMPAALYEATQGQIDVTSRTLRNWSERSAAADPAGAVA